jgi:putative lipase involved disintegration of autophagic bodies
MWPIIQPLYENYSNQYNKTNLILAGRELGGTLATLLASAFIAA